MVFNSQIIHVLLSFRNCDSYCTWTSFTRVFSSFLPFFLLSLSLSFSLSLSLYLSLSSLVRKIVIELTSVPVLLYSVCGMSPQHGLMSSVYAHAWDLNPRIPSCQSRVYKLNHYATGAAPQWTFNTLYF